MEELVGQVLMLKDMVMRMNEERVRLVSINVHTTEVLHASLEQIANLLNWVLAFEHGLWNPVIIDDDSDGETVVTDVVEENEVAIPIPPPGQLVEIVDYAREEFVPAGGGLEEGLEIERAQVDPAPEYEEAPKYSD